MKKKIAMRHAKPEDTNIIFEFIKELAEYEKLLTVPTAKLTVGLITFGNDNALKYLSLIRLSIILDPDSFIVFPVESTMPLPCKSGADCDSPCIVASTKY